MAVVPFSFSVNTPLTYSPSPFLADSRFGETKNVDLLEESPSLEETAKKMQTFVRLLQEACKSDSLKPLHTVIEKAVIENNPLVKQAIRKSDGYFRRLFSKESWTDWLEDKTPLGVVLCRSFAYAEGANEDPQDCNPHLLRKANEEARELLRHL